MSPKLGARADTRETGQGSTQNGSAGLGTGVLNDHSEYRKIFRRSSQGLVTPANGQLMFQFLLWHVDLRASRAPGFAAAPRVFVTERTHKRR